MESIRKPFQGITNIVRFNWHLYVLAVLFVVTLLAVNALTDYRFLVFFLTIAVVVILAILISLAVSFYIYDLSPLYTLNWLDEVPFNRKGKLVNINAGFDETSVLLQKKFKEAQLTVYDFYDPQKHTEISIRRARKAYPPFVGTQAISTTSLPLESGSADAIFLLLSAHEIRNSHEGDLFFKELARVVKADGKIILTEHIRDSANFLAYNIGAFHFHTRKAWLRVFRKGDFKIVKEIKITPFITTFILQKNGTAS